MAKRDLLTKKKVARKKNAEENKGLKLKKNWYQIPNLKGHFIRKCKESKKTIYPLS